MQQFNIIIQQIGIMFILMMIGYVSGKTGYLPEGTGNFLSKLVIKVTAPCLIITALIKYDFSASTVIAGLKIMIASAVFIFIEFMVAFFLSRRLKLEGEKRTIFRMHSVFGNTVYLALPLLFSIFGPEGVVFAIFYGVVQDAYLWTVGIYMISNHDNKNWKTGLKNIVNANTLAYVVGIILAITGFSKVVSALPFINKIGDIAYKTLSPLGGTTIYITMLFIGLFLAEIKIDSVKSILSKYSSFVLSAVKLVAFPLFAFFVLLLFKEVMDPFSRTIIVLQLAMPAATIVPALAVEYNSDYQYGTENVFFSTLFSMATLPFIFVFIS